MRFINSSNSEAHIMLIKAAICGDMGSYKKIWQTPHDAARVKELGAQVEGFADDFWFSLVPRIAVEVAWQKFTKVAAFQEILKDVISNHRFLIEETRNDGLWGSGEDMVQTFTIPSTWRHHTRKTEQAANVLGWALTVVGLKLINSPDADQWLC